MLRNCKGFSMMETLASFSLLLTVLIFLSSSFILITSERKDLEKKREGIVILHQVLNEYLYDGNEPINRTILSNNTTYTLYWRQHINDIQGVCIQWRGETRDQTISKCIFGKRGS
jgi:competence protein ComGE